jgi:Fe-S-cluster-containing hydrogenase component 2
MRVFESQMDVAILSGPRLGQWPTHGVRILSRLCADAGLKSGWYGGMGMTVTGVLPNEGSGGIVLMVDSQNRIHRIEAKAIVKIVTQLEFPIPFEGWYAPGLIPESTARKLMAQGQLAWQPLVVILGTGNAALRLGSELIEKHLTTRVVCVESVFDGVQGWEVEKRRFEMCGGKIIFGKPIKLTKKSPVLWELKIQDEFGIRVLDASRVITVGPFESDLGFREYPSGSFLVEWENSESSKFSDDVESLLLDEHRAVVLAGQLIKGLSGDKKIDKKIWASKQKLKELEKISERRFSWSYAGKWLHQESKKTLSEFAGVPQKLEAGKIMASIECVEPIACRACEIACPANAIKIERDASGNTPKFLMEQNCTGCGRCLQVCPSQVPVMVEGDGAGSFTNLIMPVKEKVEYVKGDKVALLNRKGEVLAQSRIIDRFVDDQDVNHKKDFFKRNPDDAILYKVEVPSHLIWEARGIVPLGGQRDAVKNTEDFYAEKGSRVEIQIQGDVRRVRNGQNLSVALFEIGMSRPNDILICEDGSCGLCQVEVDGLKKFACQTTIHQGMSIRFTRDHEQSTELCPCSGVTTDDLKKKCTLNHPESLEALLQHTETTKGRCHGIICKKNCVKIAQSEGVVTERFADWAFPWREWTFK